MTTRRQKLAWMPPLLIGAAAAVAAEVAIGILLYADTGLMRSLSTVLVTEVGAFGIGLWAAPQPGPDLVDRLRRRWLMCLLAFLGAAVFGTSWTVVRELGSGAMGQGIGLAVLAALPLYTCGSILGGLAVARAHDPRGPMPGPGAPAAMGAAIGFGVAGVALPQSPLPSSLLVACLVMLSLGGLVYGIVLAGRLQVVVRAELPSATGGVRVEDRRGGVHGAGARMLLEGDTVRRAVRLEESAVDPWDVAVARATMPGPEIGWRVLVLGGGASALPRAVVHEHPTASVEVLERSSEVVELGKAHMETELDVGEGERSSVRVGNLDDLVEALDGSFDLVVVDGSSLDRLGGVLGLSRRARGQLRERVAPEGLFVWGPSVDGADESFAEWPSVTLSRDATSGGSETVRVTGRASVPTFEEGFAGFVVSNGSPPRT